MKLISLTKGRYAIVDDEDYEWLNQWKWQCDSKGYARGRINGIPQKMHRLINQTPTAMQTDHINGNKLDNRKENLRSCNQMESMRNRAKWANTTSRYKGVSLYREAKKWTAYIRVNKKKIHIGLFENEHYAALAYDLWATDIFGEFARLNFPKFRASETFKQAIK